ncbi:hypothetical protein ACYSNR_16500 [Enterococcus sp. LJL128]|uniref:hypothetical protein n=1 Tax=Enterococcus sp. LJL51 TaxID=3416656 RepID=UPI003CF429AC
MKFADTDFSYYRRTMEKMYHSYYLKRIVGMAAALLITSLYTVFFPEGLWVNLVLILLFAGMLLLFILQRLKFNEIYDKFLLEYRENGTIKKLEEDEFTYNVLLENGDKLRINKQGSRNLPSNNKELTLLVGFVKAFFSRQPFQIVYFDMLELTYDEKYRLRMNRISRLPRFLRAFTWRNLKSSSTGLFRLIVGNLFTLYILYRLISYVFYLIRMFIS